MGAQQQLETGVGELSCGSALTDAALTDAESTDAVGARKIIKQRLNRLAKCRPHGLSRRCATPR